MADDELDYWEPEKKLAESLSPRAGAIVRYIDAIRQRAERNAEQVLDDAAAESELDVEELLRRVGEDERLMLLLASTIEAAQRASAEAKLTGLARALATGILQNDDAAIDEAQMIVATIRELEPAHLRALEHVAGQDYPRAREVPVEVTDAPPILGFVRVPEDRPAVAIGATLAEKSELLAFPIIATLVRHGLIYESQNAADPQDYYFGSYYATTYGRHVLHMLHGRTNTG